MGTLITASVLRVTYSAKPPSVKTPTRAVSDPYVHARARAHFRPPAHTAARTVDGLLRAGDGVAELAARARAAVAAVPRAADALADLPLGLRRGHGRDLADDLVPRHARVRDREHARHDVVVAAGRASATVIQVAGRRIGDRGRGGDKTDLPQTPQARTLTTIWPSCGSFHGRETFSSWPPTLVNAQAVKLSGWGADCAIFADAGAVVVVVVVMGAADALGCLAEDEGAEEDERCRSWLKHEPMAGPGLKYAPGVLIAAGRGRGGGARRTPRTPSRVRRARRFDAVLSIIGGRRAVGPNE